MKLTFPRLVTLLTFIGLAAMAVRVSADGDTWWHLRTGQWMVEHRAIPRVDSFSFTRAGQTWLYPASAWLSEIALYAVFVAWGYAGLNLFTALFIIVAFVFVYRACAGPPLLRAFVVVLAAAVSAVFWSARPQIVSFAFTSLTAYGLHQHRWHKSRALWLIVPLMALWANVHGGFALGLMLMGLTLLGQSATWGWRWLSAFFTGPAAPLPEGESAPHDLRPLGGALVLSVAALCLNPSGPALLAFPFQTVSIGALRDFIQEWQSPNFHDARFQLFALLLLGTLAAQALAPRRANLTDVLLVCGAGVLGLLAARNVPLLAIVAPPILTRPLAAFLDEWQSRWRARALPTGPQASPRFAGLLNWLLLLLIVGAALLKISLAMPRAANEKQLAQTLPLGAAEYILRARPPGPLFNSYNFGGYLTWALYPDYPVYVDGRTDLYDDVFLRDYLRVALARPGYQAALDEHSINLVLIEADSFLGDRLSESAQWRMVYSDAVAVVFARVRAP